MKFNAYHIVDPYYVRQLVEAPFFVVGRSVKRIVDDKSLAQPPNHCSPNM